MPRRGGHRGPQTARYRQNDAGQRTFSRVPRSIGEQTQAAFQAIQSWGGVFRFRTRLRGRMCNRSGARKPAEGDGLATKPRCLCRVVTDKMKKLLAVRLRRAAWIRGGLTILRRPATAFALETIEEKRGSRKNGPRWGADAARFAMGGGEGRWARKSY